MASRGASGHREDTSRIIWYFDLVSPFAYLALPAVEALARRHPVRFRPVVLGALLAHWGQAGPAEIAPKRLFTYRMVQFLADRAGMALRFPPRHPFRSLDALRLIAALDGRPGAVRSAFAFVWAEGRDPSEPAEHAALCRRLGVGDSDLALAGSDGRERLRLWTDEAVAAGVFGVPTLAIDGELFWGTDAMSMAEAYLADPELFRRDEMMRLANLPVGVVRKPAA